MEEAMSTTETNTTPMSDAELAELFNTLLECERAGVKVLTEYEKDFAGNDEAVHTIVESRRDEGKYCKLMFDFLRELGADISPRTGSFADKALAVEGKAERLAFLNRGQGWVAREIEKALPRIDRPHMREALQEMLDTHRDNIGRTDELIDGLS
ncbi:2-nitropropane dioxygenase [Pseudazoarcus pumilus]|uniref:2-nitropropane dioxygenase n=2 Tax=Pseudazoarcus pumilus TaxID=2067960 RepID=A0A2I6S373_9RHOO|nr:2-nitropropane dioxygenase [Pseudazoarcus pumilus]